MITANTRATAVPIAPAARRAPPRPTSSTRNVAGLTYRYLSIRYRSRSSSTDHAGPARPATSIAHSALPRITNVRTWSLAVPPMIVTMATSSSSEAIGRATV